MRIKVLLLLLMVWSGFAASQTIVNVDLDTAINTDYIGNGAEWDPYQLDYGHGKMNMTEAEWSKIYNRLDFMRPQLMRVVHNTAELMNGDTLDVNKNLDQVTHILDYCQKHDITVIFGDWGWGLADAKAKAFNKKKVELAADYVTFLVKTKGYTCIKYYNMINEPNGYWSTTEGNYDLWRDITLCFYNRLKADNMLESVQLIGADLAIWTPKEVEWQRKATNDVNIALYDIHTYPSKITVNSGKYTDVIKAYKDAVPQGHKIVMGEIGLKFVEKADAAYKEEANRRAKAKPYASTNDSQMFVYEYMYGTDMADAIMQTANAGYSGAVAWMLDDAMHSAEKPDKLKVWGFWNIFGDEFFGHDEEVVRPWFYAWSLLTRYMPQGSDVYKTTVSGNQNVKAIAVRKGDKTMLAVLNVSKEPQKITMKGPKALTGFKQFIYADGELKTSDTNILDPNATNQTLNLPNGMDVQLPGESLMVFTDFDY